MDWKHLLAYITGTIGQGGCFTGVDAMGETLPQTRAMSHTINTCETPSGTVAKHTQSAQLLHSSGCVQQPLALLSRKPFRFLCATNPLTLHNRHARQLWPRL
jgi:hypothetical protein